MKTITKRELSTGSAARCGVSQVQATALLQDVLDTIRYNVLAGNRVELRDFGVFECCIRKPRTGRNPKSGDVVKIPCRAAIRFKPGRLMQPWEVSDAE